VQEQAPPWRGKKWFATGGKQLPSQINDRLALPNPAGKDRIRLIAGLGIPSNFTNFARFCLASLQGKTLQNLCSVIF